jgi:hypothetical protein
MPTETGRSIQQSQEDCPQGATGTSSSHAASDGEGEGASNRHGFKHYGPCLIPTSAGSRRYIEDCCRVHNLSDGGAEYPNPTFVPQAATLKNDSSTRSTYMRPPYYPPTYHGTSDTMSPEAKQLGPVTRSGVEKIVHQQFDTVFEQVQEDLANGILPAWVQEGVKRAQPPEWPASTAPQQSYRQATNAGTKRPASHLPAFDSDTSRHDKRQKTAASCVPPR